MKKILLQIFTLWNGQKIGTRFFTWRFGKRVGQDEFGNVYYEGTKTSYGLPRRWVIYKDYTDSSSIPSAWHGWIHHRTNIPPLQGEDNVFSWEKPHHANYTGSSYAYRPQSLQNLESQRPSVTGDYSAWTPDP